MADLPILFSGSMVRALLREIEQPGTGKTQTRRVLDLWCDEPPAIAYDGRIIAYDDGDREYRWPRTKSVGDRLYVREAWRTWAEYDDVAPRDLPNTTLVGFEAGRNISIMPPGKFRQGMHMPRWASRITLIVTDIRVQRLQEISEAEALAEGVPAVMEGNIGDEIYCPRCDGNGVHAALGAGYGITEVDCAECVTAVQRFRNLWDSLNAERGYGWDMNPWVAAYTFRPIPGNIDQVRP